jgi:hypothetical protein
MNFADEQARLERLEREVKATRDAMAKLNRRARRWEKQARDRADQVAVLNARIKQLEAAPVDAAKRWWLPARHAAAACGISMYRLGVARRAGVIPREAWRAKNSRRIEYLESAILSIDFWKTDVPGPVR